MRVGLIDVDGHHFPNLALMKLSGWHKGQGHTVEWWNGFEQYDLVYKSRVFTDEYSTDDATVIRAGAVVCGGTGYGLHNHLPPAVEHHYPDYALYPGKQNTAYGFLTRGCPRACPFCVVAEKEGRASRQVDDLSAFWRGQRNIVLMDPNLLACKQHETLLQQLAQSRAWVDINQGFDIRLTTSDNIRLISAMRTKQLHFAWDNPADDLTGHFARFKSLSGLDFRRLSVYVLTNFGSTHEEDLYRVNTLRQLGYSPYVMIYNKSTAPTVTRHLQRWCNNRIVFYSTPSFEDYNPKLR